MTSVYPAVFQKRWNTCRWSVHTHAHTHTHIHTHQQPRVCFMNTLLSVHSGLYVCVLWLPACTCVCVCASLFSRGGGCSRADRAGTKQGVLPGAAWHLSATVPPSKPHSRTDLPTATTCVCVCVWACPAAWTVCVCVWGHWTYAQGTRTNTHTHTHTHTGRQMDRQVSRQWKFPWQLYTGGLKQSPRLKLH